MLEFKRFRGMLLDHARGAANNGAFVYRQGSARGIHIISSLEMKLK